MSEDLSTIYQKGSKDAPRRGKDNLVKPKTNLSGLPPVKTVFKDDIFKDKVALITGGGTGIGLRTAREMVALGATVVIASRKVEVLKAAVDLIHSEIPGFVPGTSKPRAFYCPLNVRDEESIRECVKEALKQAGRIDYLVNNAGGQFMSPAELISTKGWKAVIETNLTGIFLLSKTVFELAFLPQQSGAIVNVIANMWNGFPMMAHTGAARAGVQNLTMTLATEWGKFGIRVNSVAPGVIASSGLANYGETAKELILSTASSFNQTNRLGTEEEVAAAIIFLLTPAAAFITGDTIKVDGAESIYSPLCKPDTDHSNLPPWKDSLTARL